jgi:hypothetical protein
VIINVADHNTGSYLPNISLVCEEKVRFEKKIVKWVKRGDRQVREVTYIPWTNRTILFSSTFSLSSQGTGVGQFTFPFNFQTPMDGVGTVAIDLGNNSGADVKWTLSVWCGNQRDPESAKGCPNYTSQSIWVTKAPEAYHQNATLFQMVNTQMGTSLFKNALVSRE